MTAGVESDGAFRAEGELRCPLLAGFSDVVCVSIATLDLGGISEAPASPISACFGARLRFYHVGARSAAVSSRSGHRTNATVHASTTLGRAQTIRRPGRNLAVDGTEAAGAVYLEG